MSRRGPKSERTGQKKPKSRSVRKEAVSNTEDNAQEKDWNVVQVFYQKLPPYMYGLIHIADGDKHWFENPFVISKRNNRGEEIQFGTVSRIMSKIQSQLERMKTFQIDTEEKLKAAGIKPTGGVQLPDSSITDQILDEQEVLIEDVLISISVSIRILAEIFPGKMKQAKTGVYDYNEKPVGDIELSRVADLILHNRYIVIKNQFVVDLISDKKFLFDQPQLGLKINFEEYCEKVGGALSTLTVSDLTGRLFGLTKEISSKSNIKDIIFLIQNLYTLGGLTMVDNSKIIQGPLKSILDKFALRNFKSRSNPVRRVVRFTSPTFTLEPDLNNKQIKVSVKVNEKPEELVMDYKKFFREVGKAYGDITLLQGFKHINHGKNSTT